MDESGKQQIHAVFPTPVMVVNAFIEPETAAEIAAEFDQLANAPSPFCELTSHSAHLDPAADDLCGKTLRRLERHLVAFGRLMFGQDLTWHVKEAWLNRIQTGGFQTLHNHANSLASGVLYLTGTGEVARTIFHKQMPGSGFTFINDHEGAALNRFTATYWTTPEMSAGDLVLFPSSMIHEVPQNPGETRYSLAFNAIPDRLKAGPFAIRFEP